MDAIASLRYIFIFFRFLGVLPFRLIKVNRSFVFMECHKQLCYSKIIFFFFGLFQIHLLWFILWVHLTVLPGIPAKSVFVVAFSSVTVSMLMVIWCVLRQKDTLLFSLNRIDSLFSILSQRSLEKIKIFYKVCCALLLICIPTAVGADYYFRDSNHISNLMEVGTIFHDPLMFMATYYVTIWEVKMFVQLFFLFVNLLRFYYIEMKEILRNIENESDEKFWLKTLRHLRVQDLEIQEFLNALQEFFMPVVSMQLTWGFSTTLFAITLSTRLGVQPLTRILWLCFIFWDIFAILGLCHDTERQNLRASHQLHHLFIQWSNREIRKEIELLSLQMLHRRIEFTSLLNSKMNFTLLSSMISSLTSYTVILLQFQQDSKNTDNVIFANSSSHYI